MKSKLKVCMVVSNTFSHDTRVNKEAQSLAHAGYDVVVYATRGRNLPSDEVVNGVSVKRIKVKRYELFRLNMIRTLFDFPYALAKLVQENADVYHAHDLDTLFVCFIASRFTGAKLVYDSHELFLEMKKSGFADIWWGPLARIFLIPIWGIMEKFCAVRADCVITVSDSLKRILSKHLGVRKIIVILNCPKIEKFRKGRKFHEEFSLTRQSQVVLYQGGIAWRRAAKQLVDAVEFLPKNIYLVFMGSGVDKKALMVYASSKPYHSKVLFRDSVSLGSLLRYTSSADIGVVPLLNTSLNNYYGLPNKLFEYISVGLPVVASGFPEISRVVLGGRCGLVFNPEDPEDIARVIGKILSDPSLKSKLGRNALELARTKYNWGVEEKKLLKIYKEL